MYPVIRLGSLQLPAYGLCAMLGALCAFFVMFRLRKKSVIGENDLLDAAVFAVFLGLLGAKVLYLIKSPQPFPKSWSALWNLLREGLVFYGGLIGGMLGVFLAAKKTKKSFFTFADIILPAFCFAHAFGRIGCLLAGCCFGIEHTGCLSVVIDGVSRLAVQPMESAFLVLLGTGLCLLYVKKRPRRGVISGSYLILYAVWRFIIEFFRADDRGFVGALSTSQFIGLFLLAAGIAVLAVSRKKQWPADLPADPGSLEGMIALVQDMTREERECAIRKEAKTLSPALASLTGTGDTALRVYGVFVFAALLADGKLDSSEYALTETVWNDFFGDGADYETCRRAAEAAPDAAAQLKERADTLADLIGEEDAALKKSLVLTSLLLTAADGNVSAQEKEYLAGLLA